jgi:hypothetical protein
MLVLMPMGLPDSCLSKPMIEPAIIAQNNSGQLKGEISKMVLRISIFFRILYGRYDFKHKTQPSPF